MRRKFLAGSLGLLALAASRGVLAEPPEAKEQTRIERLIKFVENQKGMKFVRNGTEYTCEEAGKFLRGKMDAMGGEVRTARQFIKRIASKSSMSGQPYQVKFADGKTLPAEAFLDEELNRIERQPA